jgi:tetratricopeptide (TPR) repeat protein
MARLDRLGPAKEVIQIGAVIGGEFSYELLHAVHPVGTEELQSALRNATDAELVYVRGIAPEATYQFKHALIRDAAYEALLKSRRRELHLQVARAIDEKFPTLKEAHPEVLARHWTEAGETELAIGEWSRAGKAAEARTAFAEALENYRQAIALVKLLPESPERELRKLELAESIIQPLLFTAGYSAPETIDAIEHAAVLAEKSGSLKQLVDLMISRGAAYNVGGNFQAGAAVADRALELAMREGSPVNIGRAHALQIHARFWVGDLAGVEKHFTAGRMFFENPDLMRLGVGGRMAFAVGSWNAWMLGRADVARERDARMLAAANTKPSDVANMAWSEFYAASLRTLMREYEKAELLAAHALELCEQHQFRYIAAAARAHLGYARSQLGHAAEGVELIRRGINDTLETGSRLMLSACTGYLAAVLEQRGAVFEALETLEQALQLYPDEIYYRPEIFRLRGELHLKTRQPDLAQADFRDSISLARSMGAKGWELRTTMSLARLLASQGRREEARTMLAEIYNWFTEGFDTADLKDAKAMLDELSR